MDDGATHRGPQASFAFPFNLSPLESTNMVNRVNGTSHLDLPDPTRDVRPQPTPTPLAPPVYRTPKQVAAMLNVRITTVWRWIEAGKLKGFKRAGRYLVTQEAIDNFLKPVKMPPHKPHEPHAQQKAKPDDNIPDPRKATPEPLPPRPAPPVYYTPEEVAGILRLKRTAVWRYIATGKLKAMERAGRYLVTQEQIDAFLRPTDVPVEPPHVHRNTQKAETKRLLKAAGLWQDPPKKPA